MILEDFVRMLPIEIQMQNTVSKVYKVRFNSLASKARLRAIH